MYARRGRYLIATQSLKQGDTVFESPAYLQAVVPQARKKVCTACRACHAARLPVRCTHCDQAYYCSAACRDSHAHLGATESPLRHSVLCPVLRLLAAYRCGTDILCVLHMCLDALALQYHQSLSAQQGMATARWALLHLWLPGIGGIDSAAMYSQGTMHPCMRTS
jgi:hypothetical protein